MGSDQQDITQTRAGSTDESGALSTPRDEDVTSSEVDAVGSLDPRTMLDEVDPARYEVIAEHERGGLGRVMQVHDKRMGRDIAIKELLHRTPTSERRFVRESLITARLSHPGVVPVYEAGRWPTGEPFYAMKLLAGHTLKQEIARTESFAQRLALLPKLIVVCETVAFAHSRGIIHRDLKPSNIMVGEFGETTTIDWGLAKDSAEEGPDDLPHAPIADLTDDLTRMGAVVGTPSYMPPEQARGEAVDARADVYALGAIIYHLLGGNPPYHQTDAGQVVAAVVDGPPPRLADDVPVDLRAIVDKAMSRAAADRYANAGELAMELRAFAAGKLVSAHDYSSWLLVKRWLARHKALVSVAAILGVLLAVTAFISVRRIVRERDAKETARQAAADRELSLRLLQARTSLDTDPTATLAWLKRTRLQAVDDVRLLAEDAQTRGVAKHVFQTKSRVRSAAITGDGRFAATANHDGSVWLFDLTSGSGTRLRSHDRVATQIAFSPSGRVFASAGDSGTLRIGSTVGAPERLLRNDGVAFTSLGFASDRVVITGDLRGRVVAWKLSDGTSRVLGLHKKQVEHVVTSSTGGLVASSSPDGNVRLYSLEDGTSSVMRGHTRGVGKLAFSPNGEKLASISEDGSLRLWRARASAEGARGQLLSTMKATTGWAPALLFSPDGRSIASGSSERQIYLWDLQTKTRRKFHAEHGRFVYALVFLAGSKQLVSAGGDGVVRIWNIASGLSRALKGHRMPVRAMATTTDGRTLFTTDMSGEARVWSLPVHERVLAGHAAPIHTVAAVGDDGVATGDSAGEVRMWSLAKGTSKLLDKREALVAHVSYSRAAHALAYASVDRHVGIWHLADTTRHARHRLHDQAWHARWFPAGDALLVAGGLGAAAIWTYPGGEISKLSGHTGNITAAAVGPGGNRVATGAEDRSVRIWSRTGELLHTFRGHENDVRQVVFSSDGTHVASSDNGGVVWRWNLERGTGAVMLRARASIGSLHYSAKGKRLYFAAGASLGVHDVQAATTIIVKGHRASIRSFTMGEGGATAVTASYDGTYRLWRLSDLRSVLVRGFAKEPTEVLLLADGRRLSISRDKVVSVWPKRSGQWPKKLDTRARLRAWLLATTSAQVDDRGVLNSAANR